MKQIILGNDEKCPGAKQLMKRLAACGEPWIFGLEKDKAVSFINQRGLRILSNFGYDELTYIYLVKSDGLIDLKLTPCGGMMRVAFP